MGLILNVFVLLGVMTNESCISPCFPSVNDNSVQWSWWYRSHISSEKDGKRGYYHRWLLLESLCRLLTAFEFFSKTNETIKFNDQSAKNCPKSIKFKRVFSKIKENRQFGLKCFVLVHAFGHAFVIMFSCLVSK